MQKIYIFKKKIEKKKNYERYFLKAKELVSNLQYPYQEKTVRDKQNPSVNTHTHRTAADWVNIKVPTITISMLWERA